MKKPVYMTREELSSVWQLISARLDKVSKKEVKEMYESLLERIEDAEEQIDKLKN